MSVTETLGALGSWSVALSAETPDDVRAKLGFFGHVVILRGDVDVAAHGDALLPRARYVGVLRQKGVGDDLTLSGSGMVFWLGDEDGKGHVIETAVDLASATLTEAVTAVLPPTVTLGTVHPLTDPAWRYKGRHIYQSPREALQIICDAARVEFRVNGDATVDIGRPDQLYNTTAPDSVIKRTDAAGGSDVDLTAVSGSYDTDQAVFDYSTRVLLLGQTVGDGTTPEETFATGARDAPVVPYQDMRGNPVKLTRIISESGQTEGSVDARSQLYLNRFNRVGRSLSVDADQYQADGVFVVGDATYVYDPDAGVMDPARQVFFRGEVLHPDLIRISSVTWPVTEGHTVAFRGGNGAWTDLTRWVQWEGSTGGGLGTGSLTEIVVGDLPQSLSSPSGNPVQDRVDAAQPTTGDASTPMAPSGVALGTTPAQDTWGRPIAYVRVTWLPVAQNTDSSAITDLAHYEVRYRPQFRAPGWSGSSVTDLTSVDFVAVNGLAYDVQVRAVDRAGNASDWSATVSITAATDLSAPPAPSDPFVSSYLGQLRIEYGGTDAAGQPMPPDTLAVEVYVGETADFVPSAWTRVADLNPFARGVAFATAPYGQSRWVRLMAVDASGNRGPSSAAMQGATFWVVDQDIFVGAVGTAKLADLAVTTAKINNLAVNDAKVGNLSVGKLTAGIMSADVTLAGRFTTALTGARVEMNSLGFQKYGANGQLLVNITGSDALITGTHKTAATGRRIEIGAGGAWGVLSLIAPDGTTGFLRSLTAGNGGEVMHLGVDSDGGNLDWNVINMTATEFFSYRTKKHGFVYQDFFQIFQTTNRGLETSSTLRLSIDTDDYVLRGNQGSLDYNFLSGNTAFRFNTGARAEIIGLFGTNTSPGLMLTSAAGGGLLRGVATTGGAGLLEVRNLFDTGYGVIRAAIYEESSDMRGKTDIADAPITGALAMIDTIKPKKFRRKGAKSRLAPPVTAGNPATRIHEDGDEELGVLAQEMPALVVGGSEDELAINHMRFMLLLAAGLQELHAEVKKGAA